MSSVHSNSVFKNSCLKLPVNPLNKLPSPSFEHNRKINYSNNNGIHLKLSKDPAALSKDNNMSESLSDFLESIPDYGDMNHLSHKEFYEKLNILKMKQQRLFRNIKHSNLNDHWLNTYHTIGTPESESLGNAKNDFKKNKHSLKDVESNSECNMSTPTEENSIEQKLLPAKRTVRINNRNTPESTSTIDYYEAKQKSINNEENKSVLLKKINKSKQNTCTKNKQHNMIYSPLMFQDSSKKIDDYWSEWDNDVPIYTRSAPNSPLKGRHSVGWKDPKITIPKPFQMTMRDEEEKIVNELLNSIEIQPRPSSDSESKMFRANPVPIESRIPLFNKIVADQERRRAITKLNRKLALQSQIKPFSFTKREEELKEISKLFSKSSPQLDTCSKDHTKIRTKPFKAKPVPKNLFSNYFYEKMRENEYYRELKRRIRAEEMLKTASLPPSMAIRQKKYKKALEMLNNMHYFDEFEDSERNIPHYSYYHYLLHDTKNNNIKPQSAKNTNYAKQKNDQKILWPRPQANSSTSTSASEMHSINQSNLAAILRIESARKRLQLDMQHKLEEQRRRDETRWRAKIIQKRDAWKALRCYDHNEELAIRLQMRKDEERLREEEFRHNMELMLGRVQQRPYLFERNYTCNNRSNKNGKLSSENFSFKMASKQDERDKFSDDESKDEKHSTEISLETPKIVVDDGNGID